MFKIMYDVPEHTMEALMRYVNDGIEPGGFLTAVLENDLVGAISRADILNTVHLKDIVMQVYWEIPSSAWGSAEKVKEWIERGGINGQAA